MTQHDTLTLEPCPFCGRHVEHVSRADNHSATGTTYIVSCFCGGYSACAHQQEDTLEEVVAAWNRRVALSATQPAQAAQSEPTLRDYADDLVDAGHDFWKACKREAGGGAVRWLSCDDGTLIVFTRGEYRHQIMSVVSGDAAPTTVFKDDGIEAAQAAQGAGEVVADLKRLASVCPELNLNNYGPDDVDELNAWAIEVSQAIDQLADTAQPAPVVPDGWKLVPVEPTEEMLDAVVTTMDEAVHGKNADVQYREDWAAMLAATPTPPAQAAADARDAFERVKLAGAQLANIAFNLKQRVGHTVSTHDAERMEACQKEWDAALATHQQGGK